MTLLCQGGLASTPENSISTPFRLHMTYNLVDVDRIGLLPLALPLLFVTLGNSLGSLATLGSSLA